MPGPSDRFPFQAIRDAAWTANEACKRLVTPNPFYNGPDLAEKARDGLKDLERKVKLRQKLGFPLKPPGYLESQQAYEEELKDVFTDLCDTVRSHLELALQSPRGPANGPLGWDAERVREYAEAQRLATQDSARAAGRVEDALRRLHSLTPQAPQWPSTAMVANDSAPPAEQLVAAVDALVDFVRARVETCLQTGGTDLARLDRMAADVWTLVVQLGLQTGWPDSSPGYGPTRLPVFWLGEGLVISRAEFPRWEASMRTLRRCAEGLRCPQIINVGEPKTVPANDPPLQLAAAAGGPPPATTPGKPTDHHSLALLKVFTNGIADDRIKEASRLLTDDALTANEKLTKIDALIRFPATASAEQLGGLLSVTKQAVLKTDWWVQNRKGEKDNEIGRRRAGHQKRAKEYGKTHATDDDR
jgi:hypothetical protein